MHTHNFHSDFSTPPPNAEFPAVLQSSDGVYFHYDLAILVAESEFFRDMHSDLTSGDATAGRSSSVDNPIYIPKASAPALAFVLSTMEWRQKEAILPATKRRRIEGQSIDPAPSTSPSDASGHNPNSNPNSNPATGPKPSKFSPNLNPSAPSSASSEAKVKSLPFPPPELKFAAFKNPMAIIEETTDTANCYQLEAVLPVLYASTVHNRWPPSIPFALAVLLKCGNAQYYSQKLVANRPLHPWAYNRLRNEAPNVLAELEALYRRWDRAFPKFQASARSTLVVDHRKDFGSRCKPPRPRAKASDKDKEGKGKEKGGEPQRPVGCPVYQQYNGDWARFHSAILARIFDFAKDSPGLMGSANGLRRFCDGIVPCHTCSGRVSESARSSWMSTMKHDDWSLEGKHGIQGHWRGGSSQRRRQHRPALSAKAP